jgi:hypothetical protein
MRLLDVRTLEIKYFLGTAIDEYAILSHAWVAGDEVSFQDMQGDHNLVKHRGGYRKIVKCCLQARLDGLDYAWVDTCCKYFMGNKQRRLTFDCVGIDKTDSAELSESINSMYRWYKDAAVCYAFLSDVSTTRNAGVSFKDSKWFTRGKLTYQFRCD